MAVLSRAAGAAVLAAVLGWPGPPAALAQISEPEAKATLLYNLAAFVEWPAAAAPAAPLVVGIAGAPEVGDALVALAARRQDQAFVVRTLDRDEDVGACQIVFVSAEREQSGGAILRRALDAPVLTVGDGDGFTRRGGIIRVFFDRSRIRFEISLRNAARAHLRISSRLLTLARVVDGDETP